MAEVCELLDIKKTRTTAYHPQSDGMVERFNQTLEAQLSKFADHNQWYWDQHLPFLWWHTGLQCMTPLVTLLLAWEGSQATSGPVFWSTRRRARWVHKWLCCHFAGKIGKNSWFCSWAPKPHVRAYKAEIWSVTQVPTAQSWGCCMAPQSQRKKGLSPKLQRLRQGPFTVTKRLNDLVYRF